MGGRALASREVWSRAPLWPDCVLPPQTGQLEPLLSGFTEEEEQQMTRMLQRMDILAKVEGLGCAPGAGRHLPLLSPRQTLSPTPDL